MMRLKSLLKNVTFLLPVIFALYILHSNTMVELEEPDDYLVVTTTTSSKKALPLNGGHVDKFELYKVHDFVQTGRQWDQSFNLSKV